MPHSALNNQPPATAQRSLELRKGSAYAALTTERCIESETTRLSGRSAEPVALRRPQIAALIVDAISIEIPFVEFTLAAKAHHSDCQNEESWGLGDKNV